MDLNFHDYEVGNLDSFSSEFLNQVFSDFNDGIVKLYMEFKTLIAEHNNFVTAVNLGLDWATEQIGELTVQSSGIINGYKDSDSSEDITFQPLFGQFYLEEVGKESKIGRYIDDDGKNVAYVSNKVYKYIDTTWVEAPDMKKIIDDDCNIWQEARVAEELIIAVTIPFSGLDHKVNIIEVVPFAGTLIKKIEWKKVDGSFDSVSPNSKLPVQLVGDFEFSNELRVTLGGYNKNGSYYFTLRSIDLYRCDFKDDGTAIYEIGDFTEVSDIEVNDDYIDDDLKTALINPIRVELISDDESDVYYDSNTDAFPPQTIISISETAVPVKLRITLNKTEGVTPVIKTISVTGD